MYDTILVAVDGSAPSNRAVVHALDLAEQYGADLHAIFVVDTSRYGEPALSNDELVIVEIEDRGHDLLEAIDERAEKQDVDVVTHCCHGVPHREIIAYADEIDADAIVLGYQGHSHTRTTAIGSVTDRVVRSGGHPVLVV